MPVATATMETNLTTQHWTTLDAVARHRALQRPAQESQPDIIAEARDIIGMVRTEGDTALRRLTRRFDGAQLEQLRAGAHEFAAAHAALSAPQHAAIRRAIENVRRFHAAQALAEIDVETSPGVRCQRVTRAIAAVGLYVPSGSAPLPSAVIMSAVPALLAGCPQRVLCTPPQRDGQANAAILVAAELCEVQTVFKVGGAQAIAALAYGTQSIPKVDKIFGPGNAWVTAAKQLVAADPAGAALDLPAGPSEVMVVADAAARADFVAADLLAQAEHDPLSQCILLTDSAALATAVRTHIDQQLVRRTRRTILLQSLKHSRILITDSIATAVDIANDYAPEHLILQVDNARSWLERIHNAGSIFIGPWTPEPMGDYCSGTNHVLPTYGYARAYSGLSLLDFSKRMTVQELTPAGLSELGPTAITLAELEGLDAHAHAVQLRLDALKK